MDRLLLRTMVRKSVFQGGKHENVSVQQLISLGQEFYLRYQYLEDSIIGKPEYLHRDNPIEKVMFKTEWQVIKLNLYPNFLSMWLFFRYNSQL